MWYIDYIYQNEDKRYNSREASSVGFVIYAGRISKYMEQECYGGFREWEFKLYNSKKISVRFKERIQWQNVIYQVYSFGRYISIMILLP